VHYYIVGVINWVKTIFSRKTVHQQIFSHKILADFSQDILADFSQYILQIFPKLLGGFSPTNSWQIFTQNVYADFFYQNTLADFFPRHLGRFFSRYFLAHFLPENLGGFIQGCLGSFSPITSLRIYS
jgi:hypothetical protein